MLVKTFDVTCDGCGVPAGVTVADRWEWRNLAHRLGWNATQAPPEDYCPRCKGRRFVDENRAADARYWAWRLAEGAPVTARDHAPAWAKGVTHAS